MFGQTHLFFPLWSFLFDLSWCVTGWSEQTVFGFWLYFYVPDYVLCCFWLSTVFIIFSSILSPTKHILQPGKNELWAFLEKTQNDLRKPFIISIIRHYFSALMCCVRWDSLLQHADKYFSSFSFRPTCTTCPSAACCHLKLCSSSHDWC